jgi:hypothetical protein
MLYNNISYMQKTKLSRETDAKKLKHTSRSPPPPLRVGVLRLPDTVYVKPTTNKEDLGGGGVYSLTFCTFDPVNCNTITIQNMR